MPEDESRTQGFLRQFSSHRQGSANKQTDLHGEYRILELISMGAPLPEVLNQLCTSIDLQIGNAVSVILLANDEERDLQTIARSARQYGLHVFCSASIFLQDERLVGSFKMYCCHSRMPTPHELQLIQRVTHLAALAIRGHEGAQDFKTLYRDWKSGLRSSDEAPRLN